MADLFKLMKDNWRCYQKDVQDELLMAHFNRSARRKFKKDGDLNSLFKNYL